MKETQASISKWAEETFGPVSSNLRVAIRANEELAELLTAVVHGPSPKLQEEIADVAIVFYRLADRLSIDLLSFSEADRAMARLERFAHLSLAAEMVTVTSGLLRRLALDDMADGASLQARADVHLIGEMLRVVAVSSGGTLDNFVDRKMAINRGRKWTLDGTGHGYHVHEPELSRDADADHCASDWREVYDTHGAEGLLALGFDPDVVSRLTILRQREVMS